jgi:hypothetical protein
VSNLGEHFRRLFKLGLPLFLVAVGAWSGLYTG